MSAKEAYERVERWNLTDDTHAGRFFAVNEKGEPRPWTREEFVTFMERFGFRLELTVDKQGGRWTDGIRRVWHQGSAGDVHESAECGGDQEMCSALHRAADENEATK